MLKEEAALLQEKFRKLSEEHDMRNSFAYFVGKDQQALMLFNKVDDNELMHVLANLVSRIAKKHNMTTDEVLQALKDGLPSTGNIQ